MFIIDFIDNTFIIDLDVSGFIAREEFQNINDYLNTLHIHYNPKVKARTVDDERIDEIAFRFERDGYEYKLTQNAIEKLVIIRSEQYAKETRFFRSRSLDYSILNEGIKPYDEDQLKEINWNLRRSAYLDANKMGSGKTFTNIVTAAQNYKEGLIDSLLIICPSTLCFQWQCEILKFVNVFKEDDIQIIDNELKYQPFTTYQDKKVIIISNHARVFAEALLSYKKTKSTLKGTKWGIFKFDLKKIWNKTNIMLIADESHAFIHSTAIRTKALEVLKPSFEFRSLLSATPNLNRFETIYNQLHVVDKSLIPFSEEGFKLYIADEFDQYGNIKTYNTENILTLKKTWNNNFKQHDKDFKTKTIFKDRYFDLTKEQKYFYAYIIRNEIEILQEEYNEVTWRRLLSKSDIINEVFNNAELLKQKTYKDEKFNQMLSKWDIEKDPKFTALKEELEEYIEVLNEKVIIYDYKPETLNILYEKFKKYNPQIIHGSLSGIKDKNVDRKQKEDIFNYDPNCKLFLLSTLTSSAGLNLQKSCHRIIYYNMPEDGVSFQQGSGRTCRIDSTEDTIIEIFYYPKTFESIKVQRNMNRVDLNSKMGKEITQEELDKLINGIVA